MSELNGSGIIYPTIELGGVRYVIKFTRGGLLYRLSKGGVSFADLASNKSFSAVMDILHAALFGQYDRSAEDLADLVMSEGKFAEVSEVIQDAIKKVFPPTEAAPAAEPIAAVN
jgi:hypothetical protein